MRVASALSFPRVTACLLSLACLMWAGCQVLPEAQPDPTRYFLLTAATEEPARNPDGWVIGLHAIELPGYLRNNRSMVVAQGANELLFRDYDRWAEPLDAGLARVVRDALASDERVRRVELFPFDSAGQRDLDVALRVLHAEGVQREGRQAVRFVVRYEIRRPDANGDVVQQGTFRAEEMAWDGEPETLAAALGEAAAAAARHVAQALESVDTGT